MKQFSPATGEVVFDPLDVPRDAFIVGGRAWQMCRSGEASAGRFGLAPDSDLKAWWFIRSRLLHDVAAQNKMGVLRWDA